MLWNKKNLHKESANEKKFRRLENSPPPHPHNFSNGPSLNINFELISAPLSLRSLK